MKIKSFEPMKAYGQTPSDEWFAGMFSAGYYFLATDKFDGIRATVILSGLVSRTLKLIPNRHICNIANEHFPMGFDGELITYTDGVMDTFHECQSKIMSHNGTPDFKYHVFDDHSNRLDGYAERLERLRMFEMYHIGPKEPQKHMELVYPRTVNSLSSLHIEHQSAIDRGYEGLILRLPYSPYKYGRSTLNEAWMLKMKLWEDAEATIIGWEPLMRNLNPQETNVFGRQERKHGIDGKVADNMLGAFIVHSEEFGEFRIGGPFTLLQRCKFFNNHLGETITYKFQRHGTQSKPRSPKFKDFRLD